MKEYHCWRCKMIVPMLEEYEWVQIEPLLSLQVENIKRYRSENNVDLAAATEQVMKPATEKYFELTGFMETNYAAIWHHRLASLGPNVKDVGICLEPQKRNIVLTVAINGMKVVAHNKSFKPTALRAAA